MTMNTTGDTTGTRGLPLWRSMLFVPAVNERFVARSADRGADAVILDLEDSIAPSEKARARTLVRDAAKEAGRKGGDVLVRINRPWRLAMADLEASIWPEVSALVLPKIESADHLGFIVEVVEELEAERGMAPGHIRFKGLVETTRGLANVRETAKAHPRLVALSLGGEDFAHALGMPEPIADVLQSYSQQVLAATREAGIMPMGYPGSISEFTDLAKYEAGVRVARRLGYEGGSCIHPAQVEILNRCFSPTAEEIARAEDMVATYDAALAAGSGAITYEGKMIDIPIVDRCRRVLAQRDRIEARTAGGGKS